MGKEDKNVELNVQMGPQFSHLTLIAVHDFTVIFITSTITAYRSRFIFCGRR